MPPKHEQETNGMPEPQKMPEHQNMPGMDKNMPGMDHSGMKMNDADSFLMMHASGTSMNPESWQMPMLMKHLGSWQLGFMGEAFLTDAQQSGPRGGDKFYSTNWGMAAIGRQLGRGTLQFQLMSSLDPLTVRDRRYPLLFQTGETAYGRAIVDGQHPHDLIMSLGVAYAVEIREQTQFEIYFAPVGDPALGPVAFPHRASAMELPQAPLGHHWQDSTHIANEVVTVGFIHQKYRVEASGFYGTEPNENRWNIDHGPINSWSTRFSVFPTKNWMAQVSTGRLARPEQLETGDIQRTTASLHYTRPIGHSDWSSSFIWGRNHKLLDKTSTDSFLAESVAPIGTRNFVTGRFELIDKDELFADEPDLRESLRRTFGDSFRIAAYTIGYTRDIGNWAGVQTGVGANFSAYRLPDAIKPFYGEHPVGLNLYMRFRLRPMQH
jgi:hypothetical protein